MGSSIRAHVTELRREWPKRKPACGDRPTTAGSGADPISTTGTTLPGNTPDQQLSGLRSTIGALQSLIDAAVRAARQAIEDCDEEAFRRAMAGLDRVDVDVTRTRSAVDAMKRRLVDQLRAAVDRLMQLSENTFFVAEEMNVRDIVDSASLRGAANLRPSGDSRLSELAESITANANAGTAYVSGSAAEVRQLAGRINGIVAILQQLGTSAHQLDDIDDAIDRHRETLQAEWKAAQSLCNPSPDEPQTSLSVDPTLDPLWFSNGTPYIHDTDRDPAVQIMIIVRIESMRVQPRSREEPAPTVPGLPLLGAGWFPARLPAGSSMASLYSAPASSAQSPGPQLSSFITSLGNSTGRAFTLQVANDGALPVDLSGEGIVVEPVPASIGTRLQRDLGDIPAAVLATAELDAYCLEFLAAPPSPGTMFRVAGAELQARFASMRRVLGASEWLQEIGALSPDSDPLAYFHSVRQWAMWSLEERLDEDAFIDALVDHTRSNLESTGASWSPDFEQSVRSIGPGRWGDIVKILRFAGHR